MTVAADLYIIAAETRYLAIDDHEFGVERPQRRLMIVDHLQIQIGYLLWPWYFDPLTSIYRWLRVVMRVD